MLHTRVSQRKSRTAHAGEDAMADRQQRVRTAIGERIIVTDEESKGLGVKLGQPPLILQSQALGYIPLTTPEQLQQFEEDLRNLYGIQVDASRLPVGAACETCSCCSSDDCGYVF